MSEVFATADNEAGFERDIDQLVLESFGDCLGSFHRLMLALPSIYPPFVLGSLQRLVSVGRIPAEKAAIVDTAARSSRAFAGSPSSTWPPEWPLPHPLDYEWRFSDETSSQLLKRALDATRHGDTLVLLGVPSVARAARKSPDLARRLVLIDTNPTSVQLRASTISSSEDVVHCDLTCDPLPALVGQVVVLDAPWYPHHINYFLKAASAFSTPGASVFCVMPPLSTRPGVANERNSIFAEAAASGLTVRALLPLAIRYDTPFFEFNALEAEGIRAYPRQWRRGDLIRFERVAVHPLPASLPITHAEKWSEYVVDGIRIRVRPHLSDGTSGHEETALQEVVHGDILPTVSTRHPKRLLANVWTSGNRIFSCERPDVLHAVLKRLQESQRHTARIEHADGIRVQRDAAVAGKHLLTQLATIIQHEKDEYIRYERLAP